MQDIFSSLKKKQEADISGVDTSPELKPESLWRRAHARNVFRYPVMVEVYELFSYKIFVFNLPHRQDRTFSFETKALINCEV